MITDYLTSPCKVCGETSALEQAFCNYRYCNYEDEAPMITDHEQVPGFEYYGETERLMQAIDELELAQWKTLDGYQEFTDDTAIYPEDKGLEYTALGLASEAGEFAGKVKKHIRDGGTLDRDALAAELGDCLWYVARAAEELGFYMSDIAQMNVEKLKDRKARDKIKGSGDSR